jgi:glycosyltransferase EpsF
MIIKSERPDIVHAHMNLMNFCALWAAKKNNIPIRISHSHIAEKNNGKVFKIVAGFCKVLCVRYATELFTCGEEAGEYLYGKKRMKSDAIKIVENAVDLDYFAVDKVLRDKFRERFDLTDKFVVGHVGRFSFQKNHERLLDIFRELLKYKEKAVLLLVGTGELENSIRKKVEELELTDKVIFYGTTKDMKEVYSALDVFVLPSRFEGFPVVSVEIQAANIPAVFSNTIATTCKITDSINFMDLEQSDETWAKAIISAYSDFKPCDLTVLREKYDIRSKARKLDNYYDNLLELRG